VGVGGEQRNKARLTFKADVAKEEECAQQGGLVDGQLALDTAALTSACTTGVRSPRRLWLVTFTLLAGGDGLVVLPAMVLLLGHLDELHQERVDPVFADLLLHFFLGQLSAIAANLALHSTHNITVSRVHTHTHTHTTDVGVGVPGWCGLGSTPAT
jgi:hypothetical protein